MAKREKLKILYVSSEVSPFAKTGGLADVAGSLPKALAAKGLDIRIVMPKYRVITHQMETLTDFPIEIGGRSETAIIRRAFLNGDSGGQIPVYFVDNYQYFDRDNLYVYADEAERFGFFCRAVLKMLPQLDFQPDVIHCNDWQSGPICVLLKEQYETADFYKDMVSIITIHNLHYQGNFPKETLGLLGLTDYYYHPDRLEFYGDISFIKAGLVYADIINTVSKTYAREITTPEYGERLEGLLGKRSADLHGIVNGIDPAEYNPGTDSYLFANYSADSPEIKNRNKYYLQERFDLPVGDFPVVGLISRLVNQKGLDLIMEVFENFMLTGLQFILLGSGDPIYEDFFINMKDKYPTQMGSYIGFSDELAKQIYAGADMFLMPSRFEPCGLGQLMALRYGTIPVVRATGGLADTIFEYNPATGAGNGFVFEDYDGMEMLKAVKRALLTYGDKQKWTDLVVKALTSDFSWAKSAAEYESLYEIALKKRWGIKEVKPE